MILIQLGILNWQWIGIALAMDWFISGLANRPLASIEASERLADQEVKLDYGLFKELHFSGWSGN